MGLLAWLLGAKSKGSEKLITRDGLEHVAGEVFEAWSSGSIDRMLAAMDKPCHPVDRHYLLQATVAEAYRRRKSSPAMRETCERVAFQHIVEFPSLAAALRRDAKRSGLDDTLPVVTTFQQLATLLTEKGDYERAIEVCKIAQSYRLSDGTESGFKGRIERIRKKAGLK